VQLPLSPVAAPDSGAGYCRPKENLYEQRDMEEAIAVDEVRPADLPAPPKDAIRLIQACSRPDLDARDLGRIVANDPVLTAELLRVANSAYFGLVSQVKSVARAVTVLGSRALRNMVLCIAMRDALRRDSIPGFNLDLYWEDALRRAVSAKALAGIVGLDPDECFTAGLLQDFGLLVLLYIHPGQVPQWQRLAGLDPDQRLELEADLFHATHDEVGYLLASHWDLPADLAVAMGFHHAEIPDDIGPDDALLCKVTTCADWMASAYGSEDKRQVIQRCRSLLEAHFDIAADTADRLLQQVSLDVQEAASVLGIRVGEQLSFEDLMREANLRLAEDNLSYQELTWRLEKALTERDRFAARLRRELELAREVQRSLLPDEAEQLPGIVGLNVSAREVSGDFYDFFRLPDGRIAFCLADVSGKGMNAALLMAKTASLFRCLGRGVHDPAKLLSMLNREIAETSIRGMFVTMVAGVSDPDSGEVVLANAGHLPALHMGCAAVVAEYGAQSPPLGISPEAGFSNEAFNLEGGCLYLYTDGLLEAPVEGGGRLQQEGLLRLLREYAHLPPAERVRSVADAARAADGTVEDDLTLVVLEGSERHGMC